MRYISQTGEDALADTRIDPRDGIGHDVRDSLGGGDRMRLRETPSTTASACTPRFEQYHRDDAVAVRAALLAGLGATPARVAPKFLYDRLGSTLFEAITELDEYYPTRTEATIVAEHLPDIAAAVRTAGPVGALIDLGAGNCRKAMRLLPALQPTRYVAVDISVDFLRDALAQVQQAAPALDIVGLGLDFSVPWRLPSGTVRGRPVFFYPGSSIGNFTPPEALAFLGGLRDQADGGGVLIGVDLVKPVDILEAAYDDALGVTAAFDLNMLRHVNRLVGSDFSPRQWRHLSRYDADLARVEMHLEARCDLTVAWPGGERRFAAGERLHTESSHKYTVDGMQALLRRAGFRPQAHWLDAQGWFGLFWAAA